MSVQRDGQMAVAGQMKVRMMARGLRDSRDLMDEANRLSEIFGFKFRADCFIYRVVTPLEQRLQVAVNFFR